MSRKILVVDDSSSFRQVLALSLTRAGHTVEHAGNGVEGLEKVTRERYDLIISDVNMPVMNGLEFLAALKKLPNGKFTPVLMLTTESAATKMAEAKSAGAKAWITKPFAPEDLLRAVSKLVRA